MTSVERILQYSKLEQESPDHTDIKPPIDWPSKGNISLHDVSVVYRHHMKMALGPINLNIKAGEKVKFITHYMELSDQKQSFKSLS